MTHALSNVLRQLDGEWALTNLPSGSSIIGTHGINGNPNYSLIHMRLRRSWHIPNLNTLFEKLAVFCECLEVLYYFDRGYGETPTKIVDDESLLNLVVLTLPIPNQDIPGIETGLYMLSIARILHELNL